MGFSAIRDTKVSSHSLEYLAQAPSSWQLVEALDALVLGNEQGPLTSCTCEDLLVGHSQSSLDFSSTHVENDRCQVQMLRVLIFCLRSNSKSFPTLALYPRGGSAQQDTAPGAGGITLGQIGPQGTVKQNLFI